MYDRHLAGVGLTISQFSLLALLATSDGMTVATLSQEMAMERTTLLRAIRPLVIAGFIERRPVAASSAHSFHLSAPGISKVREAVPHWRAAQDAFETAVGAERAKLLRDTIHSIGFDF